MYIFRILAFLVLSTGMANAQAIWADYSFTVAPGNEAKFVQAMDTLAESDVFDRFEGKVLLNAPLANGMDKSTHSFAVIYDSMGAFEMFNANVASDRDWQKFVRALNKQGTAVSQTIYQRVGGYGTIGQNRAWVAQALQVRNPMGYVPALDRLMKSKVMADYRASLDLWQVVSGGAPGMTHIVVYGWDTHTKSQYYANKKASEPAFLKAIGNLGQYRTVMGQTMTRTVKEWGPLVLDSVR